MLSMNEELLDPICTFAPLPLVPCGWDNVESEEAMPLSNHIEGPNDRPITRS